MLVGLHARMHWRGWVKRCELRVSRLPHRRLDGSSVVLSPCYIFNEPVRREWKDYPFLLSHSPGW